VIGLSDQEQTRQLRRARSEERRAAKDLNNPGKRLVWTREKLELTQRHVCEATGIPTSSYCGREGGVRTDFWEEILVLAAFFDQEWKKKFKHNGPSFNGAEVKRITISWLMFGLDEQVKSLEILIQEYKLDLKDMEERYFYNEAELKRQLNLFADENL
jgi:transcriptional regulator with XRE-family HTH domain